MYKTISIIVLIALTAWSLFVFYNNLHDPNNWRFYAALGGLLLFSVLLGLALRGIYRTTN